MEIICAARIAPSVASMTSGMSPRRDETGTPALVNAPRSVECFTPSAAANARGIDGRGVARARE